MLAALRDRASTVATTMQERLAGPLAKLNDIYETVLPYGVSAFYYSFIPIVLWIGFSQAKTLEPKLKVSDLLSPM